jgi:integrase
VNDRSVSIKKPLVKSRKSLENSMQRSLILFHSAIKSKNTLYTYDFTLNRFRNYFLIKNYDSLLTISPTKIQEMIEDYIISRKNEGCSRSTVRNNLNALQLFFSMNDIVCNWVKLKKMLPEQKKIRGDVPYTTKQVQQMLNLFVNQSKWFAVVHFLASCGSRAGSIEELKIKHLNDMPNGCKSVKIYADTKDEYYTFIHPEAAESLDRYFDSRRKNGEIITSDSWVFLRGRARTMPLRSCDITVRFSHSFRNHIDFGEFRDNRHDIEVVHGLRKRWNTIMKSNPDINSNHAEKMLGHSSTHSLDNVYHKPLLEQLFDEYQKAIPQLIIDEKYRLEEEIKNKNDLIFKLETDKDRRIGYLETTIKELAKRLDSKL